MSARSIPGGDDTLGRFRRAVADDLLMLAELQDRELDRERLVALWEACYDAGFFGFVPPGGAFALARSTLCQGLTDVPTARDPRSLDLLAAEYADIYLNHGLGASPCESVWIDEEGLVMQEPMFQIRDWYKRHGLSVRDWRKRTDDHLVCQLFFLAHLMDPAAANAELREVARFLDEHPLRWIGDFAQRVSTRCATRLYAGLALTDHAYLDGLRDTLARILGEPRPSPEEIDQRMRPRTGVPVPLPAPFVPGAAPSW